MRCGSELDDDFCCGKQKSKILFKRDFTKQPFDLVKDFMFFQTTEPVDYIANDGIPTTGPEGLVVTSVPYTKRSIGNLDHTKFLVFMQKTFDVPKIDAEVFVCVDMTFEATGLLFNSQLAPGLQKYSAGITNIQDEPRISSGLLNFVDFNTGMVFDFMFSNEKIYALYEHLPFTADTSVFTYVIPVLDRAADLNRLYRLKIGYNRLKNKATWYIDDQEVFSVNHVGLPLPDNKFLVLNGGGLAREVDIKTITAGFGLFTILDFFPSYSSYEDVGISYTVSDTLTIEPIKPLANLGSVYFQRVRDQVGNLVPQTEFIYTGPQKIDGQGGILRIEFFVVGITNSYCKVLTHKTNPRNFAKSH